MRLTPFFNKSFVFAAIVSFLFIAFTSCGSSDAKKATADSASKTSSVAYKLGFIPLTDCASLVMAKEFGLFNKYGYHDKLIGSLIDKFSIYDIGNMKKTV